MTVTAIMFTILFLYPYFGCTVLFRCTNTTIALVTILKFTSEWYWGTRRGWEEGAQASLANGSCLRETASGVQVQYHSVQNSNMADISGTMQKSRQVRQCLTREEAPQVMQEGCWRKAMGIDSPNYMYYTLYMSRAAREVLKHSLAG